MYIYADHSYMEKQVRLDKIFFYFSLLIALNREEKEIHLYVCLCTQKQKCALYVLHNFLLPQNPPSGKYKFQPS